MSKLQEVVKGEKTIETYGFDVAEVTEHLPELAKDKFAKANEDMSNEENRAYVQACYYVYMQMKSVSSTGELDLTEMTIEDTVRLLLNGEL